MAEEALSPDDAALYFCSIDNGELRLTALDLDEYGNIRNWPNDFFGNAFGERAAMMKSRLDRQEALGE